MGDNLEGEACALDISRFIKNIVSITLFNKGKASQMFSRVDKGETLVVVKNNKPVAIILSPEEYELLQAFPKTYTKELQSGNASKSPELDTLISRLMIFDNGE